MNGSQTHGGGFPPVKVSIFHNVQQDSAGRLLGFFGYEPGHALVRVFETGMPAGLDPARAAELMFEAGNADPSDLGRSRDGVDLAGIAAAYRARNLRSPSIGDIAVIGDIPLACARAGWTPAEGRLNVVSAGLPGSVPLPQPRDQSPGSC